MKTLACLALFIPALVAADDRLWGTWQGEDPVDEATVIMTFSEDGSFNMSSPDMEAEAGLFEEMFGEMLYDLELSLDELKEQGFEPPAISGISLVGRWAAEGDSIKVWMSNVHFLVDGQSVAMDEMMVEVLTQIVSLPIDEEQVKAVDLFFALIPLVFEDVVEEELLFEEHYYFLDDGQLVITSTDGEPITLSRQDADATAVQDMSWGQIKARWP